ncbi:gluconeogenesis factor YvcK family protein [Truepera radiovictrix]|uniref:Putative gluconeogenesis factor n=1 Tax=Truepera radiovictrix (strain DSM 17093 / CIP 108686 / LMG 22925 / RQ-24) TaxID=649638 RepID=D7CS39_TRURR|nr:uridine diphosphate-N-acetylglucosamine-binding protein YvcK [Truepera radiovictrix]ADI13571.1 protein of unknown function UPF0052 and CofD [Truepera radiovictrix DSM 17093]WMT57866.1 uridine diphosphate-N-acetylglucosamine-binding protein YvcK [Truepera radiovictrix]
MARLDFRRISTARLWLTPGMGVKRHVVVVALGLCVLMTGASLGVLWLRSDGAYPYRVLRPLEAVLRASWWNAWGGWVALALLTVGLVLAVWAIVRLNRSLLSNWMPKPKDAAILLHRRVSLAKGPRIVAFGGGSGLSNLLRGLRHYTSNITAVVSVSDDGGSSGRLREAFGIPAPGDLTDCLAALSDNELHVSRLLEHRYARGEELRGHTFGNLLITTLTEVEGDFAQAVRVLNSLLNICGAVYPVTTAATVLKVRKRSGAVVCGESNVRNVPGAVAEVTIEPADPELVPDVGLAISAADLIVLGPGSLFTSTLPPLLVPGSRAAVLAATAPVVYVCNVMTEAGETDGFSAWDHVEAIYRHLGRYPDWVVVNTAPVNAERLERYRAEGAEVVAFDPAPFEAAGIQVAALDLLSGGAQAGHDSERLARWLYAFSKNLKITA